MAARVPVRDATVALPGAAAIVLVAAFLPWLGHAPQGTNADRYAVAEDAVKFIAANRRPGDRVLVHHDKSTSALALWYGPDAGLRPDGEYTTVGGSQCHNDARGIRPTGVSRVWLLRVNWLTTDRAVNYPERTALRYGRLVREQWHGGVVVLLYEASSEKASASAPCLIGLPLPA